MDNFIKQESPEQIEINEIALESNIRLITLMKKHCPDYLVHEEYLGVKLNC